MNLNLGPVLVILCILCGAIGWAGIEFFAFIANNLNITWGN